jgi:hypothetical protein
VWGHITDGHPRDRPAHRVPIPQRRQHLPDRGEPLWVADRQCCAGETMARAAAHRWCLVTWVPPTVGLRPALVEAPELKGLPRLWARPGRRQGETEPERGAAVGRPYRWKTAAGAAQEWPLRLRVGESTHRAKAQAPRRAAAQPTAGRPLAARPRPWQRRTCAGAAAAPQAASVCLRALPVPSHHLTSTVSAEGVPAKRTTRGRPPTEAPRPQRRVWCVTWQVQEAPEAIGLRAQRAGRVVRATPGLAGQHLSDAELRRADTGQPAVARSGQWAHNPAAIAPRFLETPTRMAVLGCLDVIALLV